MVRTADGDEEAWREVAATSGTTTGTPDVKYNRPTGGNGMRSVASVHTLSGENRVMDVHHLHVGESITFGTCLCDECQIDLRIPTSGSEAHVLGRITAYEDHWRLDTMSREPLTVHDLENPRDAIMLSGGARRALILFELSRICANDNPIVTVLGPEPGGRSLTMAPCPALAANGPDICLDPQAKYFSVLVALCEVRLGGCADAVLPTSTEIAQSLAGRGVAMTARAVDAQIDYLVTKLNLRPTGFDARPKRSWRKEALVAASLRRGLIGPEHLPHGVARA